MSDNLDIQEIIAQNVSIVVEVLTKNNIPNDFGIKALQWLEDFIDIQRNSFSENGRESITNTVGSYLGECMCRTYNGHWVMDENGLGIDMENGKLIAFPFAKVSKWVVSGETGDSFVGMYRSTSVLLERVRNSKQEE